MQWVQCTFTRNHKYFIKRAGNDFGIPYTLQYRTTFLSRYRCRHTGIHTNIYKKRETEGEGGRGRQRERNYAMIQFQFKKKICTSDCITARLSLQFTVSCILDTHMHAHTCACTHTDTYTSTHTYTNTKTCACTHTHTHTHTQTYTHRVHSVLQEWRWKVSQRLDGRPAGVFLVSLPYHPHPQVLQDPCSHLFLVAHPAGFGGSIWDTWTLALFLTSCLSPAVIHWLLFWGELAEVWGRQILKAYGRKKKWSMQTEPNAKPIPEPVLGQLILSCGSTKLLLSNNVGKDSSWYSCTR